MRRIRRSYKSRGYAFNQTAFRSLAWIAVLGFFATFASAEQIAKDDPLCIYKPLSYELRLTTSGASSEDHTVLVVDTNRKRIEEIDQHGNITTRLDELLPEKAKLLGLKNAPWRPHQLHSDGENYFGLFLQETKEYTKETEPWYQIAELDMEGDIKRPISIPSPTNAEQELSGGVVRDFHPINENEFLTFGRFNLGANNPDLVAFFYSDTRLKETVIVRSFLPGERANEYYLYAYIGMPLMASLPNGKAYILYLKDEGAEVGVFDTFKRTTEKPLRIPDEYSEYSEVPQLSRGNKDFFSLWGPDMLVSLLHQVEGSTMATGLISWEGHLFVVARKPELSRETSWTLIPLNLEKAARSLPPIPLPTSAAHLTILPGIDYWTLLETEPVQAVGPDGLPYLQTTSMSVIPSRWIRDPKQLILAAAKGIRHCGSAH